MTHRERPVTLVTGASSGLGKAAALALDPAAGHIVVSSHSAERAEMTAEKIRRNGGEASVVTADLLVPDEVEALVAEVVAAHGRLDHVVASGAAMSPEGLHFKLFHEMAPGDFAGVINAHWLSKAYLIRAVLPHMIQAGYGKIVNISTDGGKVPTPNESVLGGAAAGLMMMTRVIAREVGRYGVRINTITMGPLADFDMARAVTQLQDTPGLASHDVAAALTRRMLFPVSSRDVAAAVRFLLGPEGDNITGQSWSVNGGVSTS
jgi:2-hydroxycyclohexanecarboxyl-CoA dehydrogenase